MLAWKWELADDQIVEKNGERQKRVKVSLWVSWVIKGS